MVYGDQTSLVALNTLIDEVLQGERHTLTGCRDVLIRLGQIEQAAYDQVLPFAENFQQVTQIAAQLFYQCWHGQTVSNLALLSNLLNAAQQKVELSIKMPEGFAFYAL